MEKKRLNEVVKRSTRWHQQLEKKVLNDPEARAEYDAYILQLEFETSKSA